MLEALPLRKSSRHRSVKFNQNNRELVWAFGEKRAIIIKHGRWFIFQRMQYFSLESEVNFIAFHNLSPGLQLCDSNAKPSSELTSLTNLFFRLLPGRNRDTSLGEIISRRNFYWDQGGIQ